MKLSLLRPKKAGKPDPTVISVGYHPKPTLNKSTFLVVFGALLAAASFYEGTVFQRNTDTNSPSIVSTNTNAPNESYVTGNSSQGNFSLMHVVGQVVSVSDTKITVIDQRTGQNTTFTINSNTKIEIDGQSALPSDIQTAELAIITKTGVHSDIAAKIMVASGMGISGGSSTTSGSLTPVQGLQSN